MVNEARPSVYVLLPEVHSRTGSDLESYQILATMEPQANTNNYRVSRVRVVPETVEDLARLLTDSQQPTFFRVVAANRLAEYYPTQAETGSRTAALELRKGQLLQSIILLMTRMKSPGLKDHALSLLQDATVTTETHRFAYAYLSAIGGPASTSKNWPAYSGELSPGMFARVENPNEFEVKVGLRSEGKGMDFFVGANQTLTVSLPGGTYDIYFQFARDPEGLYQAETRTPANNGNDIRIPKVVNGNYGVRKVK